MDLMSLLTGFDNRFAGGRAANDPTAVASANDYVAKLKQGMIEQELMRRGISSPQPMPQMSATSNWQDSTGLGGRMAALVPSLDQPAAPVAASPDRGLLEQALANAAGEDLTPITTRRTGSGTYNGPAIKSTGMPLQAQPWYDEYVAAAQGGADLPMVMSQSGGTPVDQAKQAAYRDRRQQELAGRQAKVQSNAVADRVARHDRMGIPDQGMMFDSLERLQGMGGGNGQGGNASSPLGYLMNSLMAGGQYAQGAMEGQFRNAGQMTEMATQQMKMQYAAAISILQNPAASPQEKAMAQAIISGGSAGQSAPGISAPMRQSPGAPIANAASDQGLEALWQQRPNWQPEQFISAAQPSGYYPADVIPFLQSKGISNPRAPGFLDTWGPQDLPMTNGVGGIGWLSDYLTSLNPEPAKLPQRFQGQLP